MDVGLISFVIAVLAQQWSLTGTETSLIASAGFLGMAVGASLGGLLADRIGRRSVFAVTLLVYGLATGASALVGEWRRSSCSGSSSVSVSALNCRSRRPM